MITLGIILLLIGVLAGIPIMTTIGTILLVIGVVLLIAGRIGNGIDSNINRACCFGCVAVFILGRSRGDG